jgi:hypothetical protein
MGSDLGWFTLNVGDEATWEDWRHVRHIAAGNGVTVYPWARCRNPQGLRDLLQLAWDNGVQPIPNLETELEGTLPPALVGEICAQYPAVDVVGWSCMGWLQNSPDFSPMTHRPVLLQLFATDMRRDPAELPQIQKDCVLHARHKGFKNVGVTYQTYGDATKYWYAYWQGIRSYYTAEDMGSWDDW